MDNRYLRTVVKVNSYFKEVVYQHPLLKKIKKKVPQKHFKRISFEAVPIILGSILVGIVSYIYEELFHIVEKFSIYVYGISPYIFLVLSPVCFLGAYLLVEKYAKFAKGSGIPTVLATLELADTPKHYLIEKLLGLKIIIIKIASSVVLLLGGGSIGREGPTLQISTSIFKIISDFFPKATKKITLKTLIITGGASGLAAAFNTPLGGIVYVVEELSRTHINKLRTPVFTGVIIAGFTAQFFTGPYLFLGFPKIKTLPFNLIHFGIILSILGGIFGSIFAKMYLAFFEFFNNFKYKIALVLGLGIAFAVLIILTNTKTLGTGKPLINEILFHSNTDIPWYSFPARFFGSLLSAFSGGAGGIFATSLASGASLGHFVLSFFKIQELHYNLLILMTMVAFLTSVTRTPFTAAILVLEMTDRHSAIFYFLIAGIISQFVSELIQKGSLYETQCNIILDKFKTETQDHS